MPTVQNLTDNRPDGAQIGASATADKLGFWGATPVVQPTSASQAAVATSTITTAATTTSPWGFATSTQADSLTAQVVLLRTLVNQIRSDLVTIGILKGS